MNIPNEIINNIFEYIPLHIKLLKPLNKKYNKLNNIKLNKNILILQRFIISTKIPIVIKKILDYNFEPYFNINEKIMKRYLIRYYPKEFIKENIKLSIKKLPRLSFDKKYKLLKLINNFNNPYINNNYYINNYINILDINELCYVGL